MEEKASGAPRPAWNEAERVASLLSYEVLDTPPEPAFDEITRAAALVCRTPIALVSLVDTHRQFFKSELGAGLRETPIDFSFCAHAILQPDLFVVPDTSKDPCFASNPLVTGEHHIRFYAGSVLEDPDGLPLGTLCVLDRQPRPEGLTSEQAETLRALAKAVVAQLELRKTITARDLLAREMGHRIKNIFAVMAALASASAREHPEAAAFVASFRNRITAFGQAHEYVRVTGAGGFRSSKATLRGLAEVLLSPYKPKIVIAGDDAAISEGTATALALILHEQATNAVKYGALSADTGRVIVEGQRTDKVLRVTWRETGGPPIAGPPDHKGFGTTLTDRTIQGELGGDIVRSWGTEGLAIAMTIPSERLVR